MSAPDSPALLRCYDGEEFHAVEIWAAGTWVHLSGFSGAGSYLLAYAAAVGYKRRNPHERVRVAVCRATHGQEVPT